MMVYPSLVTAQWINSSPFSNMVIFDPSGWVYEIGSGFALTAKALLTWMNTCVIVNSTMQKSRVLIVVSNLFMAVVKKSNVICMFQVSGFRDEISMIQS